MVIDGRRVEGRTWGWREQGCPITDRRGYAPLMAQRGLERRGLIGACTAALFGLQEAFAVISELLRTGINGTGPCSACPIRPRRTGRTVPSDWDERAQAPRSDSPAWDY